MSILHGAMFLYGFHMAVSDNLIRIPTLYNAI